MGNPLELTLTAGQVSDIIGFEKLFPAVNADILIADKAYDADARVIKPLKAAGKNAVIPPKKNRVIKREYDKHLYQARHLIENFFQKLKQFRAIATRYDKLAGNFLAGVKLAAICILLK